MNGCKRGSDGMDIFEALEDFKRKELEAIKKDRKNGIPVRVNSDSYFAKEITYQTVLIKQVLENQMQIKQMLNSLLTMIGEVKDEKEI
jgi:hypothetical protein